jgi:hypothetical protein
MSTAKWQNIAGSKKLFNEELKKSGKTGDIIYGCSLILPLNAAATPKMV